ncbi:hypothetical protein ABEY65_28040 [Priestia aryabhattai]|uniref:hypothetical protein n=1 Tax=Priestia aryabhattai TaxID=412384 RepID=UPI003D2C4D73
MTNPFDIYIFAERYKSLGEDKVSQGDLLQWAIDMNSMVLETGKLPNGEEATEKHKRLAGRALNILLMDMRMYEENKRIDES